MGCWRMVWQVRDCWVAMVVLDFHIRFVFAFFAGRDLDVNVDDGCEVE